jgi:hypothetical protein
LCRGLARCYQRTGSRVLRRVVASAVQRNYPLRVHFLRRCADRCVEGEDSALQPRRRLDPETGCTWRPTSPRDASSLDADLCCSCIRGSIGPGPFLHGGDTSGLAWYVDCRRTTPETTCCSFAALEAGSKGQKTRANCILALTSDLLLPAFSFADSGVWILRQLPGFRKLSTWVPRVTLQWSRGVSTRTKDAIHTSTARCNDAFCYYCQYACCPRFHSLLLVCFPSSGDVRPLPCLQLIGDSRP